MARFQREAKVLASLNDANIAKYEAAQDDAFNAEWDTKDADGNAGGSDHSGQAYDE
jgi:hypothetical protein